MVRDFVSVRCGEYGDTGDYIADKKSGEVSCKIAAIANCSTGGRL